MMHEEKCIILDLLPNGYPDQRHPEPIAQAIGFKFSLLEFVLFPGKTLKQDQEIEIEQNREVIRFIRRLNYQRLTNFARDLLPKGIENIIMSRKNDFLEFFNKGRTITPRMHQFQLLPGIGKKHVFELLNKRSQQPFQSFEDIKERTSLTHAPVKTIVNRVLQELQGNEKYYLFVERPKRRDY